MVFHLLDEDKLNWKICTFNFLTICKRLVTLALGNTKIIEDLNGICRSKAT